jgi:hypothetical protein
MRLTPRRGFAADFAFQHIETGEQRIAKRASKRDRDNVRKVNFDHGGPLQNFSDCFVLS